jgi:hypothetical protein
MPCPSFKGPHRKLLSGKLLEDEYNLVKGYIAKIRDSQCITVVFDDWTDATGKSIYA